MDTENSKLLLNKEKILLEIAVARKNELKHLLKPMVNRYNELKEEIATRKKNVAKLAERYLSQSQMKIECDYLDTVEIDDSDLRFPYKT